MSRTKNGSRRLSQLMEQRLAVIEGCERRGEPLSSYAARTGQSARALYEAKRAARRAGLLTPRGAKSRKAARHAAPRFAEAVASTARSDQKRESAGVVWRLRLPGGAVLESTAPLDARLLGQLMTAREDRS